MSTTTLITYDGTRQNNFTLLRIFFAWLVLYGHSFALQPRHGLSDPLNSLFQGNIWIGAIAVNAFFAISGFFVTSSIMNRGLRNYSISRVLRLYPGLIVCVFITVFVVGPCFTSMETGAYFKSPLTYNYLENIYIFPGMDYILPGVFKSNIRRSVNGSLWSLTLELRCYLLLAVAYYFSLLKGKQIANIFLIALFLFSFEYFQDIPFMSLSAKWSEQALYFLIGVFFYINRDAILLDLKLALLAGILIYFSFGEDWFKYVFPIPFVYLLFYLAYQTKYLNADKYIGDISYGLYIYAFPIQQSVAHLFPDLNPYGNAIVSSLVAIPAAYLSWHLIEKKALGLKSHIFNSSFASFSVKLLIPRKKLPVKD